ncbi:hypothetical protein PR048_023590 [Dryococelus australis]|uniref:BTB domain-containing protein n=1 Tax=Dryococelus australis TaxID=614101 RepID=A0ABQ9GUL5_9NEOP|nr:hypothetical protein PR048_023590 [Dryococelus australis]
MAREAFNVLWKNHTISLHDQLYLRYLYQELVDVTIACVDGRIRAHRLVLSSCSKYFKTVFDDNLCEHPVVIVKGASCRTFQSLVVFMYTGSVKVLREDFEEFMSLADELKVRGLCNDIPLDETTTVNLREQVTTELELSGAEDTGLGAPSSVDSVKNSAKSDEVKGFEFVSSFSNNNSFPEELELEHLNCDVALKECRAVNSDDKSSNDIRAYLKNASNVPSIKQEMDNGTIQVEEEDLVSQNALQNIFSHVCTLVNGKFCIVLF